MTYPSEGPSGQSGVTVRGLARELLISEHDVWLLAAELVREGGWNAVFARGTQLTEPAEKAIRNHVRGVVEAIRGMMTNQGR